MTKKLKYLALGDSYTIGEGLPLEENFPHQLVHLLNQSTEQQFELPEIVATTGWTTDELQAGIAERQPQAPYDLVTLLIGVNNQYRGRSLEEYKQQYASLLDQAVAFAGGNFKHVVVLSIPDWGNTPYAREKGFDEDKVRQEIEAYNAAKQEITLQRGVRFLDITPLTRQLSLDTSHLTADQLHYAASVYREWAECLAPLVASMNF